MTTPVTIIVGLHKVSVTSRRVVEGEEGHDVQEETTVLDKEGEERTFQVAPGWKLEVEELAETVTPDENA